jgi:hypothetical protein
VPYWAFPPAPGSMSRSSHIIVICRASHHLFSPPENCKTCAATWGGLDDAIFPVLGIANGRRVIVDCDVDVEALLRIMRELETLP